ncbi:dipeptide ABC transporter ATP-binding protein [Cellulomonas oligotrophica]|uniref:Oligopeptide ABC transporter, ATP-binding protein n=1 Tax=Cellulomonas oligotrophica TaxID=931536 RepID=A0A7Y9FF47_9CELL|nr:ABC transporter ATP-binding protein [Cellulomonas oligotrophica]NYD85872.1 peptide/nickel transport system ATP-binding protein [Cellulomonas oligotrophica]GIG31121.1 putative oligopeptide ABC transporter, ATP-binding protein [Cellulomonas oligotrophica]
MTTTATPPARPAAPVLRVRDLDVLFTVDGGRAPDVHAVRGLSYDVHAGEVLAIVGESGSGKSVSSMALLGLLPRTARVQGSVVLGDVDLLDPATDLGAVRGRRIAMVFQDATGALDPVFTIGYQLDEMLRRHTDLDRDARRARCVELLRMVDLPDPEDRLRFYPHQMSGGQCQRVMIAMALACDPEVLVADEPTTALDVTVQQEVLDVLRRLRARTSAAIVLITHDMGVVADLADRVVVMRHGEAVEEAPVHDLFGAPAAAYTQELLGAVPRIGAADRASGVDARERPVLSVEDLVVEYRNRRGRTVRAVDGVTLHVQPGELLALVGESGSGKSTLGRCALGLAPLTSGVVDVVGVRLGQSTRRAVRQARTRIGVVFQHPGGSMNPRYTVGQSVGEPLRVHAGVRGAALERRVGELLEQVELPAAWASRYPHELSGGQRQRVAIARAVALGPDLLIADEPTSALDVSVQATVLDLLREVQQRLRFACLFISHDLAVVDALADRVAVMHRGRVVETGDRTQVLGAPNDEYTRRLLDAAPVPDPVEQAVRRERRLAAAS